MNKPRVNMLASFPRSGNKFAQQVLHHVFGLKCRTVYPVPLDPDEIAPTWDEVESDVIVKTHDLWAGEPGIYIIRDPRDVYCSYAGYESHVQGREVKPLELLQTELWAKNWAEHVMSWHQPGVYMVRYEDMLLDPIQAIRTVLEQLSVDVVAIGTLPNWAQLQERSSWYFQKGITGRWRDELTEQEIELCEAENGNCMRALGYLP